MRRVTRRTLITSALALGSLTTMRSDDLADILVPEVAHPEGSASAMFHRQGILLEWNPDTWENKVYVDGETFANLPVLGVAEAESYAAGDVVSLTSVRSRRGAATWGLIGQFVTPGTAKVEIVLSRLAGRFRSANVSTLQNITSTSYGDLTTVGPTLTDVRIGVSGAALVMVTAQLNANEDAGTAYMGFEISGASTLAASDSRSLNVGQSGTIVGNKIIDGRATAAIFVDGLTPGLHVFEAKYRRASSTGAPTAQASARNLTVFAL